MSAFTDRLYLEWAAKNGEVRMLRSCLAVRGSVGISPSQRSGDKTVNEGGKYYLLLEPDSALTNQHNHKGFQ